MKYLFAHEHSHSGHTAVSALERGDEELSTPLSDGTALPRKIAIQIAI
jgi:hypothetical protein